jgi:hypothetical protein
MDAADPTFPKFLTEQAEPIVAWTTTDKAIKEANAPVPNTETEDPNREKLRNDKTLPKFENSNIEQAPPNPVVLRRDIELPR